MPCAPSFGFPLSLELMEGEGPYQPAAPRQVQFARILSHAVDKCFPSRPRKAIPQEMAQSQDSLSAKRALQSTKTADFLQTLFVAAQVGETAAFSVNSLDLPARRRENGKRYCVTAGILE